MPCSRPLNAWRARRVNADSGKRSITFDIRKGYVDMPLTLPCGKCIFCKLEHSRNMAVRCAHEASLYENNCFLTLTYNDEHLPKHGFLDYDRPVKFMKDLRAAIDYEYQKKDLPVPLIKSFGCAEYGEKNKRPHYHLCLFNYDFHDKKLYKTTPRGDKLHTSQFLQDLWPDGHSIIGSLTFESAAYVARYVTKKQTGKKAESHYEVLNEATGELLQRPPEKPICVSKRPAIGKNWFEKFHTDVYPSDEVVLRGKISMPPKYYDRLLELANPELFQEIKKERKKTALENRDRNPEEYILPRTYVKELVKLEEFKRLMRTYENED